MRSALLLLALTGCGAPSRDAALADSADLATADGLALRAAVDGAFLLGEDARSDGVTLTFVGWGTEQDRRVVPRGAALPLPCVPLEDGCRPAVGWRSSDIEAWWIDHPRGVQQGWTVLRAPADGAVLHFDTVVEHAAIVTQDGSVEIAGEDGARWSVGGIRAWDARGAALPSTLEVVEDVLRVRVEAQGASYPVTVDPVYTTVYAELSAPSSAAGRTGADVAIVGDLNADGYDDLLVGSPAYPATGTNVGRTAIHYGRASTASSSWGAGTALSYASPPSYLSDRVNGYGQSVDGAGDVNGDGYADAVSSGLAGEMAYAYVWMHYGGTSGVTTRSVYAGTNVPGYDPSTDGPAIVVRGAGDLNGDGYDDVVTGFWGWLDGAYGSTSGEFRLHYGSAGGLGSVGYTGYGASGSYTGYAVAGAGDTDGDGYDDILVGRPGLKQVALFEGRSTGIRTTETATLTSTVSGFGASVDGAGDVNADGYDDALVGARNLGGTGQVFVYHGAAAGLSSTAARTLTGPVSGEPFGTSVAGGSDVDADGYDDILVGSPSTSGVGKVFVYTGSSSGISSAVHATLSDGSGGSEYGLAVSGDGDVDNDGYSDVVVGAPGYDGARGRAVVYRGYVDRDLDGYGAAEDCDESNASIHPGATDTVADGIDQDCDGVDTCYVDLDADNHGGSSRVDGSSLDCGSGTGAPSSDDCDDTSASIAPGAVETAGNDIDEDCDGVDSCHVDADLDGAGGATIGAGTGPTCTTRGFTRSATDCDDANAAIRPGALETAGDGVDQDCDGVDVCYVDADGDNHGGRTTIVASPLGCDAGPGAAASDDCDDGNASIAPGAVETTGNDIDEDCDGVDSCHVDADLDGAGGATIGAGTGPTCTTRGFTRTATDCDDSNASVRPGGTEVPGDGIDQDCDTVDSCYVDADGDNHGGRTTIVASPLGCDAGPGAVASDDCDDGNAAIAPGAVETAGNDIDEDCDGVDSCHVDADLDGAGGATIGAGTGPTCTTRGFTRTATDCDDRDATVSPSASERPADALDGDCDGQELCFLDADRDGYGSVATTLSPDLLCGMSGVSLVSSDCDDADAAVSPAAEESAADGVDQDCDGGDLCFLDADRDGFAEPSGATVASSDLSCSAAGEADMDTPRTDCDDTNFDVRPDARDLPADGVDQDCDGLELCFEDTDLDGVGGGALVLSSAGCAAPGASLRSDDCDDSDDSVLPGATERVADGIDQDCDGGDICYLDGDRDGYADAGSSTTPSLDLGCDDAGEAGADVPRTDCDDTSPSVHPEASEIPADGADQDCDGGDACFVDADADGYADPADVSLASSDMDCEDAGEAGPDVPRTDCDDANPELTVRRWYRDADGDGVGSDDSEEACEKGAGWSLVSGDCDDSSPEAIFAGESCWAATKGLGCSSSGERSPAQVGGLLALAALWLRARKPHRDGGTSSR